MIGVPAPTGEQAEKYQKYLAQICATARAQEDFEFPAQYMFKDVPEVEELATIRSRVPARADGPVRHRARACSASSPTNARAPLRALQGASRPLLRRAARSTRTAAWTRSASSSSAVEELGVKAATGVPRGPDPAGADQRQEVLSALREVRRARHPDLRVRRACPARGCRSRRRTSALIDEVCWFFPELKFVTRHGCEPWADLAVKLMLKWPNLYYSTSAFAPEVLPEGHRRLREHPRRRQGDVRGLLPDGPVARPHLQRDARRAVPRPRLAEVPARERRCASSSSTT